MNKITPFLWFDDKAEEAMNFYLSVFKNSKAGEVRRYGEGSPKPGTFLTASFEIEGQSFIALNGGPHYKLTPAISLYVDCKDQAEVDALWDKLSAGGEVHQCGWVTDKFGLTWQIIPSALGDLLQDKDSEKSGRVWKAMMEMQKIDVQRLRDAHAGA
jgi:predicted 3-demethylubiquinone-9 3-methyltransferase (glyoxalase superfamily)